MNISNKSFDSSWEVLKPGLYQKNMAQGLSAQIQYTRKGFNARIYDELGEIIEEKSFSDPIEGKMWIEEIERVKIKAIKAKNPFYGGFEDIQDYSPGEDIISTVNPDFDEPDNENDEPDSENDAFLSSSGSLGSKISLNIAGEFIGEFNCEEEVKKELKNWMKENNYYPSVWWVDDHGGIEAYSIDKIINPVQSVAFNKNIWSIIEARKWLKEHNYKYDVPVDKTKNEYRFRQMSMEKFNRWAIKRLKNEGINLILGFYGE